MPDRAKTMEPSRRRLQPDDLSRLEELVEHWGGGFAISPDGATLAYALRRPRSTARHFKRPRLLVNDRADVWLHGLDGQSAPRRITDGEADGAGFWAPVWSPDGRYLALVSTRGDGIRPWLWGRATGALRPLGERSLRLDFDAAPYTWLTPTTLLCALLPDGALPEAAAIETRGAERAMRAWPEAWGGAVATASVLESGVADAGRRPGADLVAFDVAAGSRRRVAEGMTTWAITRAHAVSPDRRFVAYLEEAAAYVPEPDARLRFSAQYWFVLRVARLEGASPVRQPAAATDVVGGSLHWSPDGAALACLSYREGRSRPPRIVRLDPRTGDVTALGPPGLAAASPEEDPHLVWTATGDLVALAAEAEHGSQAHPGARRDWWLVGPDHHATSLTTGMANPPTRLVAASDGSLIGVADGALWRLHPDGGPPGRIAAGIDAETVDVAWPPSDRDAEPVYRVILRGRREGATTYAALDLRGGAALPLAAPDGTPTLVAYFPSTATAIFADKAPDGTRLWSVPRGELPSCLLEANAFLRDVEPGEARRIDYRSLDGEPLAGWLLLPPGAAEGERFPLVVEVYPGRMAGPTPPWLFDLNNSLSLNLQLLAARGYAVLQPSVPLGPHGFAGDPMLDLPKGVLPAVDRAVELGVADPERVFLLGHSFGGFGVYGLVALTRRFRAAVALAGFADLISAYGTLDPRDRYEDGQALDLFQPALIEVGQGRLGAPPWRDAARYLRNSPLLYAGRIETPLLIIQGDLDYVPIQQGEEFFTALYRQGKRARFVRYWGEGHLLNSPANVRDMWQRIFAWFEEWGHGALRTHP